VHCVYSQPQSLKGQEFKNFVWACQKGGGLLDQFERYRKKGNGRVPASAPTARPTPSPAAPPLEEREHDENYIGDLCFTAEVCADGGLYEWQEYTHTVDQCSECGTFRSNPAVTRWTEADELEAEYMELVELYDPYDPDWPKDQRPNHRW